MCGSSILCDIIEWGLRRRIEQLLTLWATAGRLLRGERSHCVVKKPRVEHKKVGSERVTREAVIAIVEAEVRCQRPHRRTKRITIKKQIQYCTTVFVYYTCIKVHVAGLTLIT